MKRQQSYKYALQIKQLYKKYKILDQPNIRIIFQFCEFDLVKTSKILAIAKQFPSPISVVKKLIDQPEKSQQYLNELQARYDKIHKNDPQLENINQNVLTKKQENKGMNCDFFEQVPQDLIIDIMGFMDPYSLISFSRTCIKMNRLSKSQGLFEYYRKLCLILFNSYQPSLPQPSRFLKVKQYVLTHPQQFRPNTINFVNNNFRLFIWKVELKQFKLDKEYYLNFGSYKNLFLQCPRVNFNGYYICRHKYIKLGEKTAMNLFTPIHVIYYYRYFRFFQDGSLLYQISTKKLKDQQIIQNLSIKNFNLNEPISMLGQYIQFKNTLYLKALKDNSLFMYQLKINNTQGRICDELQVMQYSLEVIDETQIIQKLYIWNPNKQALTFHYVRDKQITLENTLKIQSASL